MRNEPPLWQPAAALILALAVAGCAAPKRAPPAPPMRTLVLPEPPPAAAPAPAPAPAPAVPAVAALLPREQPPSEAVLGYADRIRPLAPADLAQEISRLGETPYSPVRALQLALALGQSRTAPNVTRAQALLQRVLAQPDGEAPVLHPLARLLSTQLAEQRRGEEQAERQGQQLRDAQRRIDQLNERLEALRAIERSLPSSPRNEVPPPRPVPSRPSGP
ncbi:MAG TPA: hypothetical protein VLK85_18910 [Ramlibacter sp.]|nr:hypothetical protein [Ramlibacter sp.]